MNLRYQIKVQHLSRVPLSTAQPLLLIQEPWLDALKAAPFNRKGDPYNPATAQPLLVLYEPWLDALKAAYPLTRHNCKGDPYNPATAQPLLDFAQRNVSTDATIWQTNAYAYIIAHFACACQVGWGVALNLTNFSECDTIVIANASICGCSAVDSAAHYIV